MRPEIRFTPPRRARRRMAGFVMPWMLSRSTFRWRLAPPLPSPLPPFPLPDIFLCACFRRLKRNQPDRFYRPTGAAGVGEPIEARGRVRRPGVFAGERYSERGRVRRPCVSAVRIQSRVFATWPAHSLFLLFSLAIRDVCISQFYSMISQVYTDHVIT